MVLKEKEKKLLEQKQFLTWAEAPIEAVLELHFFIFFLGD